MITLHESNITSFPHDNGIGVLKDVIRAYAEEELNGLFEFYMEYDSEGHLVDELKEERIIKAKAQDKLGYQLFRIYSITKNHENDNLIVRAQHITYDLADNFVEKLEANNLTKKQVMELIGSSTVLPHPFNITSSNTTTRSSTKLYRTNPLQMIGGIEGSVLQIWGGQIERDNFNLILHDRRGSDDGVKVTYEKNLTGLEATFDISGLVTRIFPFVFIEGSDNEPDRLITVSGKYIDSPHINDYEKIYIKPIDYSNDERIDIQDKTDAQIRQQLTNIASKYFEETGNDKIKVDMEVQFEHLWETEEYKDLAILELVGMGDTVTIEHSRLKVNATAIVNYIRYDCIAEKNEEVRLGSVKARLTDNVNKVVDVAEKAERAEQTANQAIKTANGKNTIYYGPDEPEGGIEGDLWFRVVDGEYTRTYRHDGIQWQLVLSVDVRDAVNEAQQAKDEAQQAVERANQATQQATNAINQAQTAFDEAQAALSTANNALTQATSAFSLANDAFSEVTALSTIVDENTGEISTIKQSVIGLQTRVSDNEGNISNLTQIAQGLQSQVSDIEGNVSTLQQTAQGLQSSVTNLQDELDGLEIGGRNLLYNSAFNNGLDGWAHNGTSTIELTPEGYLKNTFTEARSTPGIRLLYNKLNLEKGTYTLTLKVDTSNLASIAFFRMYLIGDSSGSFYIDIPRTNGMEIVSVTFDIPEDRKNDTFYILTNDRLTVGDFIVYDWLVLMRGNKRVSDWTPAPEDIDHQFSVITQTIDSITTRVGDAEGNITALQQTSSSLAGRLTDAEGNITTLTATVNGLQTTVSNVQGDVSSVTQLANALQTRMTNAEGDISTLTQTASSLQSTVSSLRDDLDGLEIGGRNLIRNSDFSDGNSFWNLQGITGNKIEFENGYVLIERNNTETIPGIYQGTTDIEEEDVTATVWAKGNGIIYARFGGVGRTAYQTVNSDTINPYSFLINRKGGANRNFIIEVTEGSVEIHFVKLERGNKATDWTPAPEDMATQSQITQLSDAINLRVMKGDVINQINISTESILIDGKRIHITGQTTIDNGVIKSAHIQSLDAGKITTGTLDAGKVTLINLVGLDIYGSRFRSETGTDFMEITGGNIRLQQANGRFVEINPSGFYGYNSANDVRFQADSNYVTSAKFGTSNLNVYLGASLGGEIRTVVYETSFGKGGDAREYDYVDIRTLGIKAAPNQHVYLMTDHEIRATSFDKSTYRNIRGNVIYGAGFTTTTTNAYIGTDNVLHVVNKGYVQGSAGNPIYRDIRANDIYNRAIITSTTHAYIGTDNELRVVNKGLTDIYRNVRAAYYYGTVFEFNSVLGGSHIYIRPTSSGEVRITQQGSTSNYRPVRALSFNEASSRDYKTNIEEYTDSALEVINDLTVVTYNLKDDLANGILEKKIGFISEDSPAIATADGKAIQMYQLSAYNTKAIQELDMKFTNLEDEVNWLKLENQYLRQKIEQLEEMIA